MNKLKKKKKSKKITTFQPNFLTGMTTIPSRASKKRLKVEVLITSSRKSLIPQDMATLPVV
jgi:hypothetical protein